jgi:SET domain-containing protein
MKTRSQNNSPADKKTTLFDLSKDTHREKIIAEHDSITSLELPENDLLRVFKTLSAGFGVIAHTLIKKGQFICTYQGEKVVQEIKDIIIPQYEEIIQAVAAKRKQLTQNEDKPLTQTQQEELDKLTNELEKHIGNYAFVLKQTKTKYVTILSHKKSCAAALVNCSWNGFANAKAKLQNNNIIYYALRDIQPGEEILFDYGYDYTDSKDFQHIFPIGSRSIEMFLEQNADHYQAQPIALSKTDQALLGAQATHLLLPKYCSDPQNLKLYKGNQINLLPLIEMTEQKTVHKFKPLVWYR